MKTLASDNYAGALPEIIHAITMANVHHSKAYGYDEYTQLAVDEFKKHLGDEITVKFVFNGTGANVLSISCMTDSFNAVLCADTGHVYVDESTAPETFSNCRLIPLKTNQEGKLTLDTIENAIIRKGDEHYPQISALTLTQPTEYGTLYTIEELKSIGNLLKANEIKFHIDGARLFNALEGLKCNLNELVKASGVDILSVGGTKAGLLFGEAVVIINPELSQQIRYKHKQSMQLASKMRFISVQFYYLLKDELWRKSAQHSNMMANYLAEQIAPYEQIKITKPVQVNAVFAIFPKDWIETLQNTIAFYVWDERTNEVRLMCAFDTTKEEIDNFVSKISELATVCQQIDLLRLCRN